jgi:hypothetical protein
MTATSPFVPLSPTETGTETYDDFDVGDEVFCMAWLGMPFEVVGKIDEIQRIELKGKAPSSLPDGALVDINPNTMFMLTHERWDTPWYWPDRAGEHYQEVVARFVKRHEDGQIVTGYYTDGYWSVPMPKRAMSFRLSFAGLDQTYQIPVQPVAAASDDGMSLLTVYDESIPDVRWVKAGPPAPLRLGLHLYRWALRYGDVVLNWYDFQQID